MNYETIKIICDNCDPEDTITIKVKDLKSLVMEMRGLKTVEQIRKEGEIRDGGLVTLSKLKQLENEKKLLNLYEVLSDELDNNSLVMLKSMNLVDLMKYHNKNNISVRLINCIDRHEEEYERTYMGERGLKWKDWEEKKEKSYKRTAWNAIGDLFYFNIDKNADGMGKKSVEELMNIRLGFFKDGKLFTFSFVINFINKQKSGEVI